MKARIAFLAVTMGAATWIQACGSNDETAIPAEDAGVETGPGPDSSTTTDSSIPDASDAADVREAGTTLDGGACDGGAFSITKVTPQFAYTGAPTVVTINGSGFIATPQVVLRNSAQVVTQLTGEAFVSPTSMTATVPSGLAVGTYDVAVVNPDDCAGILPGALKIVGNPPPQVLSVSPETGTTQNDVAVTIRGCFFPANATLSTVSETGTVVVHTNAAPTAGANSPQCNDTPLYTMTGTIETKTKLLTAGAYVVRVTNPTDATFGEWATFVVSNPSGNLIAPWIAGPSLTTARRSHELVSVRIDDANRFLYAVGGEGANGVPLTSVETAQVDRFGKLSAWFTQKNALTTARSGLAVVRQGRYLYAIGGTSSTNGTAGAVVTSPSGTPLASIERAKVLDRTGAPTIGSPTATTGTGALAAGTYYYRVAAVLNAADPQTQGETVASDEVAATLIATGQIQLTWTAPAVGTVTHYRVYRSPVANGLSGSEVLLKDNVAGTTYTDTGVDVPGTEKPMLLGATGPWVAVAQSLVRARLNTAATITNDPAGALHVYVLGGWGTCSGAGANAEMTCHERATISADGATLGAFVAGVTQTTRARMRHGAHAMTAANGPPNFAANAGANTAFVVVAGGKNNQTAANTVEYALVTAGGVLGAWANPTGFSNERDGTQLLVANGYGYAFQGGQAANAYAVTSDQSSVATVTATTLSFGAWSNAAANLGTKVARHAAVGESAYFYIAGGTTNDADALATVYQVLH